MHNLNTLIETWGHVEWISHPEAAFQGEVGRLIC